MEKIAYLCIMIYKKYLIIAENDMDVVNEFINWSLKGFTSAHVVINDEMVMIDTQHTLDELKTEFIALDIKIVYILGKQLGEDFGLMTNIKIFEAIKSLDISDDINYFLELISSKGSVDFLTSKEKERLFELSKKVISSH
jgi:hypothetical protein